jgi:hypothetical protein
MYEYEEHVARAYMTSRFNFGNTEQLLLHSSDESKFSSCQPY